jgi:hypothetical protein
MKHCAKEVPHILPLAVTEQLFTMSKECFAHEHMSSAVKYYPVL